MCFAGRWKAGLASVGEKMEIVLDRETEPRW